MRSSAARPAAASARRGRPQPGADLRYDLRITFEEAVKGTEKEIEFPVLQRCETCAGSGAAPGTEPTTCPQCNGRGEVRSVRQTMLGQMVNVSACPRCRGEGKIVETPCDTCQGDGRTERKRTLRVTIPAGHRRGPPDPALERGRGRAARRRRRQPVRRGPRPAAPVAEARRHRAVLRRAPSRSRRRRSGRGSRSRRSTATKRSRSSPGPSPTPRSGCAARASRTCGASGARGDLHVLVDVVVPTKLSKKARELLAAYAEESGESVGVGRRRPAREARAGLSDGRAATAGVGRLAGARGRGGRRGGRGGQRDPRAGGARAARPSSRRSSWSTRVSARGSTRRGRRSSGPTCPARDRAAAERAAAEVAEALGHLQAFGLRPIGELRTRIVDEADWAEAWKAYFPVLRVGRRLVIRPTWRRHRRAARRRRPRPRSGDGVRDRAPPDDAAVPGRASRRWPTAGVLDGARVLDVGCGSGILAIAALKLGAAAALGVDTDPIAIEATIANARRNGLARRIRARAGQPAERRAGRSTSSSPTSSPGVLVAARRRAARRAPTGRDPPRVGDLRRSRSRGRGGASRRPVSRVTGRARRGRLGRARGRSARPDPVGRPTIGRCRRSSRPARGPHRPRDRACSCRRSCCRSRCGRGGRRSSRGAASSGRCCGPSRTARSSSGSGWR